MFQLVTDRVTIVGVQLSSGCRRCARLHPFSGCNIKLTHDFPNACMLFVVDHCIHLYVTPGIYVEGASEPRRRVRVAVGGVEEEGSGVTSNFGPPCKKVIRAPSPTPSDSSRYHNTDVP